MSKQRKKPTNDTAPNVQAALHDRDPEEMVRTIIYQANQIQGLQADLVKYTTDLEDALRVIDDLMAQIGPGGGHACNVER